MTDHLVGEGKLFQPDVLLPSQFGARVRGRGPQEAEFNLIRAVLDDAIHCFKKYRFAKGDSSRELYEEARDWIESTDRQWPFSYENICMILGIDPDYLRAGLARWEEREASALKPPRVADLPLPDFSELDDLVAAPAV
jgi:hypothetical protein